MDDASDSLIQMPNRPRLYKTTCNQWQIIMNFHIWYRAGIETDLWTKQTTWEKNMSGFRNKSWNNLRTCCMALWWAETICYYLLQTLTASVQCRFLFLSFSNTNAYVFFIYFFTSPSFFCAVKNDQPCFLENPFHMQPSHVSTAASPSSPRTSSGHDRTGRTGGPSVLAGRPRAWGKNAGWRNNRVTSNSTPFSPRVNEVYHYSLSAFLGRAPSVGVGKCISERSTRRTYGVNCADATERYSAKGRICLLDNIWLWSRFVSVRII